MFNIAERIERLLFEPVTGPKAHLWGPVQRLVRFPYAVLRDLLRGELTLRAMSLVYTTLLSIVPLLAFSFAIFKGLGIYRDLEPVVFDFFEPVGDKASELTARVMGFVENISSGVLGSLGLAFLLFTVVSMIQKMEESLNFVWRVERPRSFARRITEYLSLIVVGPIVVVALVGLTASLADTTLMQRLEGLEPFGMLIQAFGRIVPWLFASAIFTFLYRFIPNTRVPIVPAMAGGMTAGMLWVVIGAVFAQFVVYSTRLQLVYTSFAILVSALIWIYVAWLILLLGAQLSFYVQNPQYLRRGQQQIRLTPALAEQLALNVMVLVGKAYRQGEPGWTTARIAARLDIPSALLSSVIRSLESANLLVATEDERLLPGRDMAEIDLAQIVDAARRHHRGEPMIHVHGIAEAERLATLVELAVRERLEGKTLREVVDVAQ